MRWLLITLIVLLLLFAVWQLVMLWRTRRREGKTAPPLHEVLPPGVKLHSRMLLYFYSEHCGACRGVTPLIDDLSLVREGVVKVDVRRHIETARRFGIMDTPSLVLIERGLIERVHVGPISGAHLQQFFDSPRH